MIQKMHVSVLKCGRVCICTNEEVEPRNFTQFRLGCLYSVLGVLLHVWDRYCLLKRTINITCSLYLSLNVKITKYVRITKVHCLLCKPKSSHMFPSPLNSKLRVLLPVTFAFSLVKESSSYSSQKTEALQNS